uniref:Uncharacterized protein ycf18 n=1 Tax=Platysiphonia delicata TaxID=2006979 RepID=A0A1Z1M0F5_9FLOR|nr:phycobilisome degradation protein [Platysiphonia delicata]ARW59548.1 phycobilisome degradation protein [Platysiphonia delicata]
MDKINRLTLEQEFQLIMYKKKIMKLNKKQIKKYLKYTLEQMMIKDNIIRFYIKKSIL